MRGQPAPSVLSLTAAAAPLVDRNDPSPHRNLNQAETRPFPTNRLEIGRPLLSEVEAIRDDVRRPQTGMTDQRSMPQPAASSAISWRMSPAC